MSTTKDLNLEKTPQSIRIGCSCHTVQDIQDDSTRIDKA